MSSSSYSATTICDNIDSASVIYGEEIVMDDVMVGDKGDGRDTNVSESAIQNAATTLDFDLPSMDEEVENRGSNDDAKTNAEHPNIAAPAFTRFSRKPVEQCNYYSIENRDQNKHKLVDLFTHATRRGCNCWARTCTTCFTSYCLNLDCWDPLNHKATLRKHPELLKKEMRDQQMIRRSRIMGGIFDRADGPPIDPVEDYELILSDFSEEEQAEDDRETMQEERQQLENQFTKAICSIRKEKTMQAVATKKAQCSPEIGQESNAVVGDGTHDRKRHSSRASDDLPSSDVDETLVLVRLKRAESRRISPATDLQQSRVLGLCEASREADVKCGIRESSPDVDIRRCCNKHDNCERRQSKESMPLITVYSRVEKDDEQSRLKNRAPGAKFAIGTSQQIVSKRLDTGKPENVSTADAATANRSNVNQSLYTGLDIDNAIELSD